MTFMSGPFFVACDKEKFPLLGILHLNSSPQELYTVTLFKRVRNLNRAKRFAINKKCLPDHFGLVQCKDLISCKACSMVKYWVGSN